MPLWQDRTMFKNQRFRMIANTDPHQRGENSKDNLFSAGGVQRDAKS
jgi:hypothetical protein